MEKAIFWSCATTFGSLLLIGFSGINMPVWMFFVLMSVPALIGGYAFNQYYPHMITAMAFTVAGYLMFEITAIGSASLDIRIPMYGACYAAAVGSLLFGRAIFVQIEAKKQRMIAAAGRNKV